MTARAARFRPPAVVSKLLAGQPLPDAFKAATVASAARETYRKGPAAERDLARLARKVRRLP